MQRDINETLTARSARTRLSELDNLGNQNQSACRLAALNIQVRGTRAL